MPYNETPKLQPGHIVPVTKLPMYTPVVSTNAVTGLESLQLVQMFQSGQDNLFAGLLNLACKEDLVQNGVDLKDSQPH